MAGRRTAPGQAGERDRLAPPGGADPVLALFDRKAASWSAKYQPDGRLAGRLRQLSDAVGAAVRPGGELLDLGCGSGDLARPLAAAGYRVVGCDIAPAMLRAAAAADPGLAVRWVRLDPGWRTLPFESASLDAVVASSLLEYVSSPTAVLHECARVLRPGGTLLCTVPDLTHPMRWLEWPLAWAARAPVDRVLIRGWPRLASYRTYLRVSRQRWTVRRWHAVSRRAGLQPVPGPSSESPRAPLRLLTFAKPGRASAPAFSIGEDICDNGND